MKHYIVSVWRRPPGSGEHPVRYLVTVFKGVKPKKYAVGLALGVICGTERAPFMPFSWKVEKVSPEKREPDLGRPWIERDDFEVRKLAEVKAKLVPRS